MYRSLVGLCPNCSWKIVPRAHLKKCKSFLLQQTSFRTQELPSSRRSCSTDNNKPRFNPLEIQMLSENIHRQVFRGKSERYDTEVVQKCREHLSQHNLWGKSSSILEDVDFNLPSLVGSNIDEHFREIAEEQSKPYFDKAQWLAESSLPAMPGEWCFSPGWTKYQRCDDGVHVTPVDFPQEDAMMFDIEICVKEGPCPTLAVAVSPNAWYSWVSETLVRKSSYHWLTKPTLNDFIPLETNSRDDYRNVEWKEKLVIGHSVGFDRSYIKEQYLIKGPKMQFLDTLSLHMCISGLTGLQRGMWQSANAGRAPEASWMLVGSGNKLLDLHKLYCGGNEMDKSLVKVFIEGTLEDVRTQFQELVTYCAKDTLATHEVFVALWPQFLSRFPHPVTFAGMLEMGSAYLPIDQAWEDYIRDADDTYHDLEKEMRHSLMHLADASCNYLHNERYRDDPWLWKLDWSVQNVRTKKLKPPKKKRERKPKACDEVSDKAEDSPGTCKNATVEAELTAEGSSVADEEEIEDLDYKESTSLLSTIPLAEDVMYKRRQHLPGYPGWYRELSRGKSTEEDWEEGAFNVSPQCQVAPLLLRMTWDGFPLHYNRKHGWGYLVPGREDNLFMHENEDQEELIETAKADATFPTASFQELWRRHEMNKPANNATVSMETVTDDDVMDVHQMIEATLWTNAEYAEMKEKPSTRTKPSPAVQLENSTGNPRKAPVPSAAMDGYSQPGFYSGVGPYNDVDLPGVWFFRIPHKNGESYRCGNPLAKDYINKMEDGTLVATGEHSAHKTLVINKMISSWRNAKKRIKSQLAVWFDKTELPVTSCEEYNADNLYGAILPRVITAGTVTRRAVEPTWLTASNPREDRVGSELKALVRAPPGYSLVGADVDSQELWIAAILGDAHFAGIHGSTAFGWMTLQGKRSEGTDLHSKTAETIGISRDHAKIFNYGRIYGAGQKFTEKLLQQFNHRLTEGEARQKAERLYTSTKGAVKFKLTDFGVEMAHKFGFSDHMDENNCVDSKLYYQLLRKSSRRARSADKNIDFGRRWYGGSESEMFNKLESIAQSQEPRTPVLGCRISRALEPSVVINGFMTSRVNWVVQSSAVDYLHLMVVCMKWLFTKYNIDGRFCISIHDEVRYLVSSEDKYRAALALQITNLLTRAMFAYKLGMNDLPQSVAFFSAVDIDKVLRKEVNLDCRTPSNPLGLEKGHGIPPGEALDIYEILKRTNGSLDKPEVASQSQRVL